MHRYSQTDLFAAALHVAPDLGCIISANKAGYPITHANAAVEEMLGYSNGELLRTSWEVFTDPKDLGADLEQLRELLAGTRDSYVIGKNYIHKSGRIVPVVIYVHCFRDDEKNITHFIAWVRREVDAGMEAALKAFEQKCDERFQALEKRLEDAEYTLSPMSWAKDKTAKYSDKIIYVVIVGVGLLLASVNWATFFSGVAKWLGTAE